MVNTTIVKQAWNFLQVSNQEASNVRNVRLQKLHSDFEKFLYAWIEEYFRILYKSIGYIQSNEEIWREDRENTYGIKDSMLATK